MNGGSDDIFSNGFAWEMSFTLGEILHDCFGPQFEQGLEWRIIKEPDKRVKRPEGVPLALMRVEVTLLRERSGAWAFAYKKPLATG